MKRKLLVTALCFLALWTPARADQIIESAQQKLKDQGFYYGEITGKKDTDTTAAIRRYQIRNGLQITGEINAETQRSLGLTSKPAATPRPRPATTPVPKIEDARDQAPPPTPTNPSVPRPPPPQDLDEDAVEEEDAPDDGPVPRGPQFETAGVLDGTPFQSSPPQVQRDVIISVQTFLTRQGYYREPIDGLYGPGMAFALRNYQARFGLRPTGRLDVETLASLSLLPEQQRRDFRRSHRRVFRPRVEIGPFRERIYIPR
jgi:peptidoglycan hydrolase-like protein with peptidoglycan-binding domain